MLILEKVTKFFNKGTINEVHALKELDLIVERADFVTVIGSNGAGKSTMLNCVAGGFYPDSGRLVLSGHDITRWPEHKRAKFVGRVFQDPLKGTCASLTIEQNLALALRRGTRRGLALGVKERDRELFRDKLQHLGLGLEHRLKDQVGLLSGGQRQALTMLMATMVKPDLLLLDEHTAALDPKTATQILELTEQIVESEKLTTLMVTHNMNQALSMGNRLIMLHQGEIILDLEGEDKRKLTVDDLLQQFYTVRGEKLSSDRMLLA
ncbi:ABC transporter ATP-binding protein [Oceanidesulfovibrio indonesiensis]|uniref:ABC transporter ATP-binding protein n=1 Tax=Oceanidesulfovibrio indonesiensis TaxID=54767 RepID=A0A7M3MGS1_9BACT|nr:ATP-binding cassette domain-containing protein [Oceanidesulfovibrio indonesiensis]TVM18676.1 ABC transporter ATP-binding protein [Oceanidesulfovibrio indonesiensis]